MYASHKKNKDLFSTRHVNHEEHDALIFRSIRREVGGSGGLTKVRSVGKLDARPTGEWNKQYDRNTSLDADVPKSEVSFRITFSPSGSDE